MTEAQMRIKGRLKRKFQTDVNPDSASACTELLRSQARAAGARTEQCEIAMFRNGRKVATYRGT